MKMKVLAALSSFSLLFLLLLAGCQQEEMIKPDSPITFRAPCTPTTAVISYSANPTTVNLPVTISVTLGNAAISCGKVHLSVDEAPIDGVWVNYWGGGATPASGVATFTYTPTTTGTYKFRTHYVSSGGGCTFCNSATNILGPDLVVISGCVLTGNSFAGVSGSGSCGNNRSATYTLCSQDGLDYFKIQGGLTNFTGGDATVTTTGGNITSVAQHTPGNSSNRIITVIGSIDDECTCVSIQLTWTSTNGNSVITGQWSAKDSNSTDIAPPVAPLVCQ